MTRTRTIGAVATLGAAAVFFVAGPYMVYRGFDARDMVSTQLKAEHIVTPEDASKPNVAVVDGPTAMVQADIIQKHAMESTKGKSYAQLDREDPARQTAFNAAALRTSLMSASLAWEVANLVIGLGVLVFFLGVILLAIGLVIRKPEQILISAAPESLREPVTTS